MKTVILSVIAAAFCVIAGANDGMNKIPDYEAEKARASLLNSIRIEDSYVFKEATKPIKFTGNSKQDLKISLKVLEGVNAYGRKCMVEMDTNLEPCHFYLLSISSAEVLENTQFNVAYRKVGYRTE